MSAIAAISTGMSPGGIGIVRISGENAVEIADRVFISKNGKPLRELKGYSALFGTVHDAEHNPIDEAVALVFRAPKSYTGEDVVEISCHGGLFVTKQVLRAVLAAGAVSAQAGEFTKRAFLNGKMDLAKAESVMNIISSRGGDESKAAFNALNGKLSDKITRINKIFISASASLQAWVDYPDDEIEEISTDELIKNLEEAENELEALLKQFDSGRAIIGGVKTAIVGRPNVGKSTLMNMLLGEERSIVTPVAGTTRDVVEETALLGNITLRLADTAGLRETEDEVEKIGVERAKKCVDDAQLVLAVFELSQPLDDEDRALVNLIKDKKTVAILNKSDLSPVLDKTEIERYFGETVVLSAKNGDGLEKLQKAVEKVLDTADFDSSVAVLLNERQRNCCIEAKKAASEAVEALKNGVTLDAVNVTIDCAVDNLLALTGEKASDAVVNEIFSRFCVGK